MSARLIFSTFHCSNYHIFIYRSWVLGHPVDPLKLLVHGQGFFSSILLIWDCSIFPAVHFFHFKAFVLYVSVAIRSCLGWVLCLGCFHIPRFPMLFFILDSYASYPHLHFTSHRGFAGQPWLPLPHFIMLDGIMMEWRFTFTLGGWLLLRAVFLSSFLSGWVVSVVAEHLITLLSIHRYFQ